MNKIIDETNLRMINAIERNFSDFFLDVAELTNTKVCKSSNYKWVKSEGYGWPSGIFDLRLNEDEIDSEMEKITSQMKTDILPGIIMTGPLTEPKNYTYYFEKYGLIKKSEAIGMALKMSDIKTNFNAVESLDIIMLDGEEYLFDWARVVCLGLFGQAESDVMGFYNKVRRIYLLDRYSLFLGIYKGKVVSSSLLFLSNNIVGIYHVATLPEYRNMGIGKQITLAPLIYARNKGYNIAILQATKLGEIIYEKIGFKKYCLLGRYRIR